MKKKIKKLLKNKTFIIFMILFIIFLVCIFMLRSVFITGGGSKYGNRLDGIKKISFTDKNKKSITSQIEKSDKVKSAKINVHGKIINVIFDVKEDTSKEDAKAIAQSSLEKFSDKVKGFYDIEFMITKKDEKGEEVKKKKDDGTEETIIKKQFPIMGYKNPKRNDIVW